MHIKATVRRHYTHVRMAKIKFFKKLTIPSVGEKVER